MTAEEQQDFIDAKRRRRAQNAQKRRRPSSASDETNLSAKLAIENKRLKAKMTEAEKTLGDAGYGGMVDLEF